MADNKFTEELFSVVRHYNHMLRGCVRCKILWLDVAHASHMTEQTFWILAEKIFALNGNSERLNASELAEFGIHFSSTFCASCVHAMHGNKYRTKQREEGNFPCFGTATNGYCDQHFCKYRGCCITHKNAMPGTRQHFDHVFAQMKASSIVIRHE